jgi:hypothetical protein
MPSSWEKENHDTIVPDIYFDIDYRNKQKSILKNLLNNLLDIEAQMSEFIDQRYIPPDLKIAKKLLITRIENQHIDLNKKLEYNYEFQT